MSWTITKNSNSYYQKQEDPIIKNEKKDNINIDNIKERTSSSAKKIPGKSTACPNKEGHQSCIDFVDKFAEMRGVKFAVYQKQLKALHMMIKCGYTMDDIQKKIRYMNRDKFWDSRGFDLMTVANELDKGGKGGSDGGYKHPNQAEKGKYDDIVER